MKIRVVILLALITGFISCNNDDDGDKKVVEIRNRAEQQVIDNDSIIGYLETHYYNSDKLSQIQNISISDLVITRLAAGQSVPVGSTLLKNAVDELDVVYKDTDYKYYVLNLNKGGGVSPTFSDNIWINYEGFTLDNAVFDSRGLANPKTKPLDLTSLIPGWSRVLTSFKTAGDFAENNDGTVNYLDTGLGIMFLPSGLAYFSRSATGILSYSPLIFKFELLQTEENDHDGDGIPSHLEDLNNDGAFFVNFDDLTDATDDDTDGDGFANFIDADDDNDGVLTINEDLEDTDLNVDSDGDGDPTNDKNGDGDPTNDDTDGDGIPNYLDADDTESNA